MNEDQIKNALELADPDGKMDDETVEKLIEALRQVEPRPPTIVSESYGLLSAQLEAETDWRKRAAIAAKIISLDLDY